MKSLFPTLIFLLFTILLKGQYNLYEDFSGTFPPPGWTIEGNPSNWSKSDTREALGLWPECRLHYDPAFYDTLRLISPVADLTGIDTLEICYLYTMANKGSGCTFGVATRSNGGSWHDVWHYTVSTYFNSGPNYMEHLVTSTDVGRPGFQVCFYFYGGTSSDNFFDWYLDNIHIFSPPPHEITISQPGHQVNVDSPYSYNAFANIRNLGQTVESFPAHARIYDLSGNLIHTEDLLVTNLDPGYTNTLQFNPYTLPGPDQCYIVKINTDLPGDFDARDDTMTQVVSTYTHSRQSVLMELSTSTGCGYCPQAEKALDSMVVAGDRISLVAYHTAFADPYENSFSINRVNDYYGFWGMPTVYADGYYCMVGVYPGEAMFPYYQQFYNNLKDIKTPFGIAVNGTNSGNQYSVQVTISRYAGFTNRNLVVQCVLTESGLQFADTFNWVLRLMIPDENGTQLDLSVAQQVIPLQFNIDQDWKQENLAMVVFIQDPNTRRVLDATTVPLTNLWPLSDNTVSPDDRNGLASFYPNPFSGRTSMDLDLKSPGTVLAVISDLQGKVVKTICNGQFPPGMQRLKWNGTDDSGNTLPGGTYLCRIVTRESFFVKKIILLR